MNGRSLLKRIHTHPHVIGGLPTVRGFRITVDYILELLAGGTTHQEILENFPEMEEKDITACLLYAAELTRKKGKHPSAQSRGRDSSAARPMKKRTKKLAASIA